MGYTYRDPKRTMGGETWRQTLIRLHAEPVILDPADVAEWARYMSKNMIAQADYDHEMYVQEMNQRRREGGGA